MRRRPLLVLCVLLAGCLGTGGEPSGGTPDDPHAPGGTLGAPDAPEPGSDNASVPAFSPSILVARHEGYGFTGEPAVEVDSLGRVFVAAPFLTLRDFAADGFVQKPGQGFVWRSDDGGGTFHALNDEEGRLAGAHGSTSDTDVAARNGTVYFVNGGESGHFLRSTDGGTTWTYAGAVDPRGRGIDRPWIVAHDGGLTMTWAVQDGDPRTVSFSRSTDGGRTWSEPVDLTTSMTQFGPPAASDDGRSLYQPYVRSTDARLRVLVSHDGGSTWEDTDVGRALTMPGPGAPPAASPTAVFPVAAVDAAGTAYLAWSEYRDDGSTRLAWTRSLDGGARWDEPVVLTPDGNAVMPWLVAGDAGRLALFYLGAATGGDPNVGTHEWYLEVRSTTDADGEATFLASRATPGVVHLGSICPYGAACAGYVTPFVGDRTLLDYFEAALAPDGNLVVAWTETHAETGRNPEIRFARQDGGMRLVR